MDPSKLARLRAIYDGLALTWHANHGDPQLIRESALRLNQWLLPKSRILDVGCATGRDVALWRSLGHECVGVDLSPAMVAEARRLQPDSRFEVGDITHMRHLGLGRFDAFWAAGVILHIPKTEIGSALVSIARQLKLAGVGCILTKEGQGEGYDTLGRFTVFWQEEELFNVLTEHHYQVLSHRQNPDMLGRPAVKWLEFMVMAVNG